MMGVMNVRLLVLSTCLVGCAGRAESERGRDEPSQPDDEASPAVVSASGGAPAHLPTASGGSHDIDIPVEMPPVYEPVPECNLAPRVEVTTALGTVVFDTSSDESSLPESISLWTVQCSSARDSELVAYEASSGSEYAMGGAHAAPDQRASLSLNFMSHYDGQTWVVAGLGEYVSPWGERFDLVLDQAISPDLLEIQPQLETTIRYLGINAEGQTESFEIALSVCSRFEVCTI